MGKIQPNMYKMLNGENFEVRTALPTDADQLIHYTKNILDEAPYLLTSSAEFEIKNEKQKQHLQEMHDTAGKLALLADYGGEIIGFLDFHCGHRKRNEHQGSFGMSVKKEFRNQGIGKALLMSLIVWAENNPLIEKIRLEVFSNNKHAVHLYKRFGFIEERIQRRAVKNDNGSYEDIILMALFLN
ncbi:GNAT family N-acetyltransferase [Siminovitchia acidinfaciens]|uniref:GNAT family N-acetyltransferase n=1 Tax=Siminovitchia acidinfaciens TaxID=2321395 RepID=A0A429Y6M4_9BACI|nr:GNAT family N-acetyltransferase [Siminovitchia acidinfaciens]RST76974.1 GNAT family N-acetyltransferase [Siminovitchia acidinfaciens]